MGKVSIKKILPGARQSQQLAWRNDGDQVIGGSTRVHDVFVGTFVAVPVANIRVQHPSLVLGRSLDQGPPLAPQPPPGTGHLPPTSAAGFRRAGGVPVRPQGTGIPGGSNPGRQPVPPPDERDDSPLWPLQLSQHVGGSTAKRQRREVDISDEAVAEAMELMEQPWAKCQKRGRVQWAEIMNRMHLLPDDATADALQMRIKRKLRANGKENAMP